MRFSVDFMEKIGNNTYKEKRETLYRRKKMLNLSQKEMKKYYDAGKEMIWNYRTLYQIFYSQPQQQYYISKIITRIAPVTKRGQFNAMTPEDAQQL